jgi:hypothetical protein
MGRPIADKRVTQFARDFSDALQADSWGHIDPDLFDEIGTQPEAEWSDDAKSLALALRAALL